MGKLKPKFYDTPKGMILEKLTENKYMTYLNLKNSDKTLVKLTDQQFKRHTGELQKNFIIKYNSISKSYRIINSNLKNEYTKYLSNQRFNIFKLVIRHIKNRYRDKIFYKHISFIDRQIITQLNIQLSYKQNLKKRNYLQNNQFFLNSSELTDITKLLIKNAKYEIQIINYIVDDINITKELINTKNNNQEMDISIITNIKHSKYNKFHDKLRNNNINIFYNENIHAKFILVDHNFLIISSMNFTPHSVSGKSIESGIFTNDIDTIEKADLFFYEILEG